MAEPALRPGPRLVAILAAGAVLAAFVLATRRLAKEPLSEPVGPSADPSLGATATPRAPFASNADCRPCHREIWDECAEDQHAQAWFNTPLLAQDPKRSECNNCHAPEPILETGLEALAVIRTARFEEGVGCIECHRNGDHVEGPLPGVPAACNPVQNEVFQASNVCNACHAAHGSFAEWQGSAWAREGVTCQGCHMPLVERPSSTGGAVRRVRSHRMRSQRDPEMLREAMTLEARLEGRQVLVSLANTGTGHNLPGEIFNRELFVATSVRDETGREQAAYRESLKTVKREQRSSEASTQLAPGEVRRWIYALPEGHGAVEVAVRYKLFFMVPDSLAGEVHARTLEF